MKVRDVRWCIMLLVAVCVGTAAAEDGGRSAPAVFEGDPRLLKSVSLQEHRIYLGDLLERVRSATGVRLGVADQPDAVSGFLVTAVVHDRPAWELLDALAGLYSTRQDRWYWRRSGNRKAPVYRLEYP
ncbi:MAG: hypothetical protein FJX77_08945, partial [Armatimonadetes bacterium]|nr:hypothetical protein [Armatimonadota bacterium]